LYGLQNRGQQARFMHAFAGKNDLRQASTPNQALACLQLPLTAKLQAVFRGMSGRKCDWPIVARRPF